MTCFVYILKSQKDGKRYVGLTDDIERRIKQHNVGRVVSTRSRRPFVLERFEEFSDRVTARVREKYYKTAAGRRFLDKL